MRLNKFLALCGIASRRKADEYIAAGRVAVNGRTVRGIGSIVRPNDKVTVDGVPAVPLEERSYLMMNKPKGYLTTIRDERGRPTVMDLLPEKYRRRSVYPIGRLDRDTEGLLLFTNDGELSFRLSRPEYGVRKEYLAVIDRPIADIDITRLTRGVFVPQLGMAARAVIVDKAAEDGTSIRVILTEGKKRQVRLMLRACGYRVKSLERISYGPLRLGRLKRGRVRPLREREIRRLKQAVKLDSST